MRRISVTIAAFFLLLTAQTSFAQNSSTREKILIATPKPYDRVIAAVRSAGGTVKHQYSYVDGIAAEVPTTALTSLRSLVGSNAISKDEILPHPVPADVMRGKKVGEKQVGPVQPARFRSAKLIPESGLASFAAVRSNSYGINAAGLGLPALHAQGLTGEGVVVAVIDSGIRPSFPALELDKSVIGGIDLVGDGLGFSHPNNDGHGTFVASMISGNAEFDLSTTPAFLAAISANAPSAVFNGNSFAVVGSAPAAKIYAVRVFGTNLNVGAPESTIIAAIQHVIDKRKAYDQGNPAGLKIDVCNFSLGNTTLAAGRDLFDQSVDALLAAGIIPVVSAGNAGPTTLTIASPGSSFNALTVGAASFAANERIFQDFTLGPGKGVLWRPFSGTQTAFFSSRGPNADGRIDPDVVASGFDNIGQGYFSTSELTIASGTSFSAPIVSGIAAILRQAFPRANANEIRNAIIASGNADAIADGSSELDRGRGLVNAEVARALLAEWRVSERLPEVTDPNKSVRVNIERNTQLNVQTGQVKESLSLKPGQRRDILYQVNDNVEQVVLTLDKVKPALPPTAQNALFADDILLFVHSSKTSSIHQVGDYLVGEITLGGSFVIDDPEPGILRISVMGDWTNAGNISTDVTVSSSRSQRPKTTAQGEIAEGDLLFIPIDMPAGVQFAEFRLSWNEDWSNYPTNDVDLILYDPQLNTNSSGATLNLPERVAVQNPKPGTWYAVIHGFDLPAGTDKFRLSVLLDGRRVKP